MRRSFTSLFILALAVFGLVGSFPSWAREDIYQGSVWDRLVGNTVHYKEAGVTLTGLIDRKTYTDAERAANPDGIARAEGLLDQLGPVKVLNMWNTRRFVYPGTVLIWDFTVDTGRRDINGADIDIHQSILPFGWKDLLLGKKMTSGIVEVDCDTLPDKRLTKFRFYAVPKTGKDLDDYAHEVVYKVGAPQVRVVKSGEVDPRVVVSPTPVAPPPTQSPTATPAPVTTSSPTPSPSPSATPTPQPTARPTVAPTTPPTTSAPATGSLSITIRGANPTHVIIYDALGRRSVAPVVNGVATFSALAPGPYRAATWPKRGFGLVMSQRDLRKPIVAGQVTSVTFFKEGK